MKEPGCRSIWRRTVRAMGVSSTPLASSHRRRMPDMPNPAASHVIVYLARTSSHTCRPASLFTSLPKEFWPCCHAPFHAVWGRLRQTAFRGGPPMIARSCTNVATAALCCAGEGRGVRNDQHPVRHYSLAATLSSTFWLSWERRDRPSGKNSN